jgi:hypothetical protein
MAELTFYRCDPDGKTDGDPNVIKSINKMAQNAKECNSSCKKTNWTIKTKINERANKILVEMYENGIYIDSTMYESSEASFNIKGEPIQEGETVQIFDKENWAYRSGRGLASSTSTANWMGQRVIKMKDGKYFSTYEYAFDYTGLIPGYYPYQACGK